MTMLEALVAMVVLVFGLLGMSRFQAKIVQQGTDAQLRMAAIQFADRLANYALAGGVANAACYTVPAAGTCANAAAKKVASDWAAEVAAALPGTVTATSAILNGRLTVTIGWTGKGVDAADDKEARQRRVEVVTDVRF
ncbi:pilus assembly protein PilV [Aquincola sp. MAHUQ-54]|uniref:Pilus assembly protein PilV n=1 Tax=Aquincola agrisoli TaxID=3119538 RepID=A0AAW9QJ64_9BURK